LILYKYRIVRAVDSGIQKGEIAMNLIYEDFFGLTI
jgi:hypothetical protein